MKGWRLAMSSLSTICAPSAAPSASSTRAHLEEDGEEDCGEDEEGNEAYHIRLKGIPSKCIQAKCDEAYSGDPMLMFHDLFEGKEVEFDLESGGNCVFKTNKDHSICTGSMTRKVCFERPDQVLTEDSEEEL